MYPYGSGQGIVYGAPGINSGFPYSGQGNYNPYYPIGARNLWSPPGSNVGGPLRSGVVIPRTGSNIAGSSSGESSNRPQAPPSNPTNK
jgi:hypothetical protein